MLNHDWTRGVMWVAEYSPDAIVISLTKPSWQVLLLCTSWCGVTVISLTKPSWCGVAERTTGTSGGQGVSTGVRAGGERGGRPNATRTTTHSGNTPLTRDRLRSFVCSISCVRFCVFDFDI